MNTKLAGRGGAGRGQGRKPLTGPSTAMKSTSIKLTDAQRAKLLRLGGSPWVRAKVDQACEPGAATLTKED